MSEQPSIFLAGASRGVGRAIALELRQRGCRVKALLRSDAALAELSTLGVECVLGDALDPQAVKQAMQGDALDGVISTIGGVSPEGQRSDYWGNRHLIDAAVQAGIPRFILVSSIGTGDSVVALAPHILQALAPALAEKEKAEAHLIASGLNYTIIRPGGLKSEPATGTAVLTPDPTVAGSIHRADVAHLVCQCVFSARADYKTLSAVDRNLLYQPREIERVELTEPDEG